VHARRNGYSRGMRSAALSVLAIVTAWVLHADPIATGQIVDKIAASSDPEMTYAVYLPPSYSPDHKSPVVFVLDPRRRGAFAADLFRDAADQFGWIVISSNNTESDSQNAPNMRALQAMFADAPARFSVDETRIYLAGFSGTANVAFSVAENAKGAITGVIGCSGWLPASWKAHDPGFAWFGTAGNLDFNFLETRSIDDRLATASANHRVEFFAGPHRWAPKPLLAQAAGWMELQAMRRGLRAKDPPMIATLLDADAAAARAEPDVLAAMRRFDAIVRTFEGLADVAPFRARAAELRASDDAKHALDEERHATEFENTARDRLPSIVGSFLAADETPLAGIFARDLGIPHLLSLAKESSPRGLAAQRVLESIYAQVNFYLPQQVHGPKLVTLQAVAAMIHTPK
jgi:predicted esterase